MSLRDDAERVLRAWNRHEVGRGASPVVDYDCAPIHSDPEPLGRLDALEAFTGLARRAEDIGDEQLSANLTAHRTYLRAKLGERLPLDDYVRLTQGCRARGWAADRLDEVRGAAREGVDALGIGWGPRTDEELNAVEQPLDPVDGPDAIRQAADEFEPAVRALVETDATFELSIETVKVDAYWSYWLDGAGSRVRLRLNLRNARFTAVQARQFALHEILGHGMQSAAYAHRCAIVDVGWVRLLAVHAQHQVMLEGLAQAMPLFVAADDDSLVARVRLAHYTQLVLAELHVAVNDGVLIEDCAARARALVPWWTTDRIADSLTDRATDPALRSYLWAYPAGLDWFCSLAANASSVQAQEVLRAAYRDPLSPTELDALWPAGPTIGGP